MRVRYTRYRYIRDKSKIKEICISSDPDSVEFLALLFSGTESFPRASACIISYPLYSDRRMVYSSSFFAQL